MRGQGFGCIGNILIGAVGGLIGGFLFRLAGVSELAGLLGSLVTALVGALVLLLVAGLIRKAVK
ncbi:MAG: GlsB/YeaQ/YmgE family stress response membrane protein [Chloroflexi bacterium]|nr:GlsB/YeaQ/YmgE family stress response membrane protein [Chloroflexota bacterium]MDA1218779.1 GlsB/YeaQ/YmgE family stress response membrane protein [Chloroflexota bacterium]PKB57221.1 MAG: transglycosylase [SAR202 cluster bacterium Casp-Chloro-G3]